MFQKFDFELPNGEFCVKNTLPNLKILLDQKDQEERHHSMFNGKNCQNGNNIRTYRLHISSLTAEQYVSQYHDMRDAPWPNYAVDHYLWTLSWDDIEMF